MKKAVDAFRSIGEVSQLVGVAPHVLRYWETQFPLFSPVKRRDGRRYYRPDDVKLAAGLCELLREEGVTIRGAKKQMAADRGAALKARGAARLPAMFGDDAEATTDAPPKPAAAPRKRKAADAGTLPLFAELGAPAPESRAVAPKATPKPAATKSAPKDGNWLIRLQNLRADLHDLPADPATLTEAARLLARLQAARYGLSR